MDKSEFRWIAILISCVALAAAQQRCKGANECDAQLDRKCRPLGGCERFCDPGSGVCSPGVVRNCYCQGGFARNATGVCIPRENCPRECGDRECPSRHPSCRCEWFCRPSSTCVISPSGCHCARGYARDSRDVCVPQNTCR